MENPPRYSRNSQSMKQRSGYEPSDTETEWQETPWHDSDGAFGSDKPKFDLDKPRNLSPLKLNSLNSRQSKIFEYHGGSSPRRDSVVSPARRRHSSKSPYKPRRDDGSNVSPIKVRKNVSPFSKSELRRHVSNYKPGREEHNVDDNDDDGTSSSNRKQNHRTPTREERSTNLSYSRRTVSAPRPRVRAKDQQSNHDHVEGRGDITPSPLQRSMSQKQREVSDIKGHSVGEINEMVANAKISRTPGYAPPYFESTDSIAPGDIFFSRDYTALSMQKNVLPKNGTLESHFSSKPTRFSHREAAANQRSRENGGGQDRNPQRTNSSSGLSRTTLTSSSAVSRESSGKLSTGSSKMSDASGKTSVSLKKFTANVRKSQSDAWFSCMRKGPCKTTKSPEKRPFDEASFIEKAFVVEHLRQFWADKHQPGSLNGFVCHKQEAQVLEQIVSQGNCPHILFKGPSGSGKRALAMAFLHEIYGDPCWNISHELRYFQVQERRPMQVVVPLTYSAHHVELNLNKEANARLALMSLVKEIRSNYSATPEISNGNLKADYKVLILSEVDKAAENIQHLVKWIMDCYTDVCKLIICCEDDIDIIDTVKSCCKIIEVDALVTHEIMEVLIQIARKEDFDLPMSFAAKIASKSKQNLRKAIMALEACKAHNYPFVDDQPIPLGWEEVLVELAAEVLSDPSPKRLFFIRGKFQKLLVDFVHPKLILQKLVEEFLKRVEASSKRELYYWHAYYEKRLPTGTSALLKLEEFVAKFMSIQRRSSSKRHYL